MCPDLGVIQGGLTGRSHLLIAAAPASIGGAIRFTLLYQGLLSALVVRFTRRLSE